jgi:hypothetical protein
VTQVSSLTVFRGNRDAQTIRGLLKNSDLMEMENKFADSKIDYFGFLTLFCTAWVRIPAIYRFLLPLAHAGDRLLFRSRRLARSISFKFVFFGKK